MRSTRTVFMGINFLKYSSEKSGYTSAIQMFFSDDVFNSKIHKRIVSKNDGKQMWKTNNEYTESTNKYKDLWY